MSVSLSPSNPGVIYDPRFRAAQTYLAAVEADLKAQTKDFGLNIPGNRELYEQKYQPLPSNLFTPEGQPNPEAHGFSPGRRFGFTGVMGTLGGVRRIG